MKKGLTLIEVMIAIAILSIIIAALATAFGTNMSIFRNTSREKIAIDNLRTIEGFIAQKVVNAEELEILENIPNTFERDYEYIYSLNGDIFHVNSSGSERELTDNSDETFDILFTKLSEKLLGIYAEATTNSSNNKSIEVNIKNFGSGKEIEGVSESNVIKFKLNIPEVDLEISEFRFTKSSNSSQSSWPLSVYEGVIDQDTLKIFVEVDAEVDIKNLVPTEVHNGDKLVYRTTSIMDQNTEGAYNFTNNVFAIVSNEYMSKTYEITVVRKGIPRLIEFGFDADKNTGTAGYVGNESNTEDKRAFINEETREVMVSLDSLGSANSKLNPYFLIEGDYIEVNGLILEPGENGLIDFNPGRVFGKYEYAINSPETSDDISLGQRNEYTQVETTLLTVYAKKVGGGLRSKTYEIYNTPYGYSLYLSLREDEGNGDIIYNTWIDEKNLLAYIPNYSVRSNERFLTNYMGSSSGLRKSNKLYSFPDLINAEDEGSVLLPTTGEIDNRTDDHPNGANPFTRIEVYNEDVYDKTGVEHANIEKTDKFYGVVRQDAGLFKLYYENTGDDNTYLYQPRVEATIRQGGTQNENSLGDNNAGGEINVIFPQNEYLEDLVATFVYMGDYTSRILEDGDSSRQTSEESRNNIEEIREYYVASQISKQFARYKYVLHESDAPELELVSKELIEKGSEDDRVLGVPDYKYIKGINRDEKSDGAEYRWYYVPEEDEDKVGTGEGAVLGETTKDISLKDYEEKLGKGFVYAGVRTKSDTYEVDSTEYGGVETNWDYTDAYEVDYGEEDEYTVYPGYTFFAAGSAGGWTPALKSYASKIQIVDTIMNIHSNGGVLMGFYSIDNASTVYLEHVLDWVNMGYADNNSSLIASGKIQNKKIAPLPTPDYLEVIEKSIENTDKWEVGGSKEIQDATGIFRIKATGNSTVTINQRTTQGSGNIGTAEEPTIIYVEGNGRVEITGNFYGENHILVYAPNGTVNFGPNGGRFYLSVVAREIDFSGTDYKLSQIVEVAFPR